jgi:hypothetical protein
MTGMRILRKISHLMATSSKTCLNIKKIKQILLPNQNQSRRNVTTTLKPQNQVTVIIFSGHLKKLGTCRQIGFHHNFTCRHSQKYTFQSKLDPSHRNLTSTPTFIWMIFVQSLLTHPPRQLIEIHAYIINFFFFKVNDNIKFLSRMDDLHPNTMEAAAVMS